MVFVGRDEEWVRVHQWLAKVTTSGTAHVLLVEGEAGIGKTRLVDEVQRLAVERSVRMLRGAAHELERIRPFGAVADALGIASASADPERARIAHLLFDDVPTVATVVAQGPNLQYLVSEGIVGLVETILTDGPTVIALEDLHWSDPSTVHTVATLARRLAELPLAVLITFRPVPKPPELDRLIDVAVVGGANHLRVGRLDDGAVDALATSVTGGRPGAGLRAQLAKAQGNPLYVLELLDALREDGGLELVDGQVEAALPGLPPDLRLTLLRRLSYLDRTTIDVLRIASVLGGSFDVKHLGLALGRSTLELLPALRQALEAGVLREDGERLAFRHDLVRDAIYEDLPSALRAGIHAQVAATLADAGVQAAVVAGHVRLGASHGDRKAIRWLHSAGPDAMGRDPAIATELLEQAVELADRNDPECEVIGN